tara:strand:+ start:173 stop:1060 length:888 start_codon:yes stop_codon:yes gene_type:complete
MKIFDCTTFYNEKMMMDLRFNILNEHVVKFIVVESTFSHSGKSKKLNFDANDYPKFKDRIEYIVIDKEPTDLVSDKELLKLPHIKRQNSLKRIEQSYNYMLRGLVGSEDEDLIIISDNDEIPNLESKEFIKKNNCDYYIFEQLFFYYKFNLLYDRMKWHGTKGCKKKKLKNFSTLRNTKNKEYPFWRIDTFFSDLKQTNLKIIKDGGWHFTNVKKPKELFEKLNNFGHHDEFELSNLKIEDLENKIKNKEVFYNHLLDKADPNKWRDDYKLKKIDEKFLPKFLIKNHLKYQDWFD